MFSARKKLTIIHDLLNRLKKKRYCVSLTTAATKNVTIPSGQLQNYRIIISYVFF